MVVGEVGWAGGGSRYQGSVLTFISLLWASSSSPSTSLPTGWGREPRILVVRPDPLSFHSGKWPLHSWAFNSFLPHLTMWKAAHRGSSVQAKGSPLSCVLFASVWKIIIPQKAIHTTKAQWHYSLPLPLSTVLLYNWQLMLERTWNGGEITAIYQLKL